MDSACLAKIVNGLVAVLVAYLGSELVKPKPHATTDMPEAVKAAWATLVFNGKTIDWIGDPKIMAAAASRDLKISFVNASDDALKTLHMKPMVDGVGVPALILQAADGHIVHLSKVETVDEVVAVLSGLKK